jgi:hypothetical protein
MHRICTRSLKKKENKESIDYRGILENLEYMFLFPISKEPKSFTLQLVVPIKEVGPKSKIVSFKGRARILRKFNGLSCTWVCKVVNYFN